MKAVKGFYRFYWTMILALMSFMALMGVFLVPSWGERIMLIGLVIGCIALIFWLKRLQNKERKSKDWQ